MNTNAKKKVPTLNKKPIIIAAVALLLLTAITLGLIFTLNWYFVDTPYDWVDFDEHIEVPKYMGVELSEKILGFFREILGNENVIVK